MICDSVDVKRGRLGERLLAQPRPWVPSAVARVAVATNWARLVTSGLGEDVGGVVVTVAREMNRRSAMSGAGRALGGQLYPPVVRWGEAVPAVVGSLPWPRLRWAHGDDGRAWRDVV